MWLYIPSNCAPASACSEKAQGPDSSISASSTEPFATWSAKPLQPRSLPALWKREPLIRVLSGLTCSPSMAQRGADAWISSLRVSRAKTSASPAGVLASMASDRACSSTSSTSPTIAVRSSSFWRTSAPSLLPPPPLWTKPKASFSSAPPPESWENWPIAGGTRSGSLFPRPTWAPVTDEHDGFVSHGASSNRDASTWMTPSVSNSQGNAYTRDSGQPGQERLTLTGQAQQWPTPRATDGTKGGPNQAGSKGDLMLPSAAAQWPTPMAQDAEQSGSAKANMLTLHRASRQWPTPASRDYRTPNSKSLGERGHGGTKGEQLPNYVEHHFLRPVHSTLDGRPLSPTGRTLPRRLNPAFACWLMGWPIWWTNPALTNCVKSEMELFRRKLGALLSSLLGDRDV